jgi:hypothetical protein
MRRLTNKEISRVLAISERTVKFHVSHILAKFGLDDRRGLLPETYFNREGIFRPGQDGYPSEDGKRLSSGCR